MRKWIIPITIVCIISGFLLSFQLKVQASNTDINPLGQKNLNLVTIIKDLESEIKNLENHIEKVRNDLNTLRDQESTGQLQELQNQLKQLKLRAGLTPVIGNGIIITLDDNKAGLEANPKDDPNKYIVHYEHILNLVSELKVAGAEAISVNGQRIVTTSEIRCVGNVILINTTRIAPPFEIRAIGSPKLLAEIVSNGELELLKASQYPLELKQEEEVPIPAYKGELQFHYAQLKKEG